MTTTYLGPLEGLYIKKEYFDSFRGFTPQADGDRGVIETFKRVLVAVQEEVEELIRNPDDLEALAQILHSENRNMNHGTTSSVVLFDRGVKLEVCFSKNQEGDKLYTALMRKLDGYPGRIEESEPYCARSSDDSRLLRNMLSHINLSHRLILPEAYAKAS